VVEDTGWTMKGGGEETKTTEKRKRKERKAKGTRR
jgi:hypothetical protein